jgi:hypothetical protein
MAVVDFANGKTIGRLPPKAILAIGDGVAVQGVSAGTFQITPY